MRAVQTKGAHEILKTGELHPCIWCGKLTPGSVEHVLPESLGCPEELILRKGVCKKCNNSFSHLDQALLHEFEIVGFMYGVGRKGKRPPHIDSWAAVAGTIGPKGPEMHVNGGPGKMQATGKILSPAHDSNGIINFDFSHCGGIGKLSFSQIFGRHRKFVRALHKVAFEGLAIQGGLQVVNDALYDPIRAFVTSGVGKFRALLLEGQQEPVGHGLHPPMSRPGSIYPVLGMIIFGVTLIVDTDPEQSGLAHLLSAIPKQNVQCTVLPFEVAGTTAPPGKPDTVSV